MDELINEVIDGTHEKTDKQLLQELFCSADLRRVMLESGENNSVSIENTRMLCCLIELSNRYFNLDRETIGFLLDGGVPQYKRYLNFTG